MKTCKCWCIILFFCIVTVGHANGDMTVVKPPSNVSEEGLLSVASNGKYGLDCFFYGDHAFQLITDMLLYERISSRYRWYKPYEGGELDPFSFYENVWSPNEEYLVLPLGRFEGFHILHASNALENLNQKEKGFIRVFLEGTQENMQALLLWHSFWKWVGDDAFLFSAGISYTDHPYIYEIGTKTLFSLESDVDAENEDGRFVTSKPSGANMLDDRDIAQVTVGMTRGIVLLRFGEPASPRHLPVWIYPSKEGYYHYIFYFWPTNDVELPAGENDSGLRLVAITKVTLEDRGYTSEKLAIKQETYIFPEQIKGKAFTGLKTLQIRRY